MIVQRVLISMIIFELITISSLATTVSGITSDSVLGNGAGSIESASNIIEKNSLLSSGFENLSLNKDKIVNDIIKLIPSEYKEMIKDLSLEHAKEIINENSGLINWYFKQVYGFELTTDLMNELIEEIYYKLT